jgi:3-oxoisoapionate decarboxylase
VTRAAKRRRPYLNVYGSRYSFGLQGDGAIPASPESLIRCAHEFSLGGIELPVVCVRGLDRDAMWRARTEAERLGVGLILSSLGTEPDQLRADIVLAQQLGARVLVTAVAETRFAGDRRHLAGEWPRLMKQVEARITSVVRDAERAGVVLGIENHQDLDSADMVSLCQAIESEAFGVTFDCANGLGVVELPSDVLDAVAQYVVHVHVKDYRTQWKSEGYALVRCAVGDGVIPFGPLVSRINAAHPRVEFSIEVGALVERVVRVFADDFWADHRPRSAAKLATVLGFVGRSAVSEAADLRTPFERGEGAAAIRARERTDLERSVEFVQSHFDAWTADVAPLPQLANIEHG